VQVYRWVQASPQGTGTLKCAQAAPSTSTHTNQTTTSGATVLRTLTLDSVPRVHIVSAVKNDVKVLDYVQSSGRL
jgi:hypothetical protein